MPTRQCPATGRADAAAGASASIDETVAATAAKLKLGMAHSSWV
jgi:hypothetical protein